MTRQEERQRRIAAERDIPYLRQWTEYRDACPHCGDYLGRYGLGQGKCSCSYWSYSFVDGTWSRTPQPAEAQS